MYRRLLVLCLIVSSIWVLAVPAQAQDTAWYEGVQLRFTDGFKSTFYIVELRATKLVDGDYRASQIEIYINGVDGIVPWVQETVVVPGDPDALSVSGDLGWGGLHTTVMVTDQRTGATLPMTIHLDQFAIASYEYDPSMGTGMFVRSADARGYIEFPGRWRTSFTGASPFNSSERALNFSTSWPG